MRRNLFLALASAVIWSINCSEAQTLTNSELTALVKEQQQTIELLKTQVELLKNQMSTKSVSASTPAKQADPVTPTPVALPGSALGSFNPEIGVVGDIVGTLTESSEDGEGNDEISAREVELVIGHDIDPYSRFDSTIAFSDNEDPHLEEAYITHWGLPGGFKFQLGRMRPNVGIAAKLHRDSLETVDEPLVVASLFGEEGFARTGLEISNFIPSPWKNPVHEITFGVLEGGTGHGGELFGDTERRPTGYARLRHSIDLSDASVLNIGNTFLVGSADEDSKPESRAFGIDASLVHNFNAVNRFKFQSEAYIQDRSEGVLVEEVEEDEHEHEHAFLAEEMHDDEDEHEHESESSFRENPLGFYALADYRLSQRWSVGSRYDYLEPINREPELQSHENAYSGYLTFHQSEFARWRFQYQYADMLDGKDDNRFFLQATVAIGTHKHQIQ